MCDTLDHIAWVDLRKLQVGFKRRLLSQFVLIREDFSK